MSPVNKLATLRALRWRTLTPHRANAEDCQDIAHDRHGEEAALVPAKEFRVRDGQENRYTQQAPGALPVHDAHIFDHGREKAELQHR